MSSSTPRPYIVEVETADGNRHVMNDVPGYEILEAMNTALVRFAAQGLNIKRVADIRPDDAKMAERAREFLNELKMIHQNG